MIISRCFTFIFVIMALMTFVSCPEAPPGLLKLSSIEISEGTLIPQFDPATTSYSATVSSPTASITVTLYVGGDDTFIVIDGDTVFGGTIEKTVALAGGPNTITIIFNDGEEPSTYTLLVTRDIAPEILVRGNPVAGQPAVYELSSGAAIDFGDVMYQHVEAALRIENIGNADLHLLSNPPDYVRIVNDMNSIYSVPIQPPGDTIPPGGYVDAVIRFESDSSNELKTATALIESDDPDEGSYELFLSGFAGIVAS